METTNKKECPKCKSLDVFDRGDRVSEATDIGPYGEIAEPNQPIYECRNCGELFIFLEGS